MLRLSSICFLLAVFVQPCTAVERISFQSGTSRVTVSINHEGIHIAPAPKSKRSKAYELNLASVEALGRGRTEFAEKLAKEAIQASSEAMCELNNAYIVLGWTSLTKSLDESIEYLNRSISDRILGEVQKHAKMPRDSKVACFGFEFWSPDLSLAIELAKSGKSREVAAYVKRASLLYQSPNNTEVMKSTVATLKQWTTLLERGKVPQSEDSSDSETFFVKMPDTRPDLFGGVKPKTMRPAQ